MSAYNDCPSLRAFNLVSEGKAHRLAGRLRDAAECFALALDARSDDQSVMAEALRWLGIVHHLQGQTTTAQQYGERSVAMADRTGTPWLAAKARLALGNFACDQGRMHDARALYAEALELATDHRDLTARIEHNLGIVASIEGRCCESSEHYVRALAAYTETDDALGRARVHHDIGMLRADQKRWDDAAREYHQALALARQCGDYHLVGLCMLNHADIDLAQQRFEDARRRAESALAVFDRVGARVDMASAYRTLGIALRYLNRPTIAESRLRTAVEIAMASRVPRCEAESCRDIGALLADTGRHHEAIHFIDRALGLFRQIGALQDAGFVLEQRSMLMAA